MMESILNTLNSVKGANYTLSHDVRVFVVFCQLLDGLPFSNLKIPPGSMGHQALKVLPYGASGFKSFILWGIRF